MAWYPGAEKMELQPESDEQPAITPTQVVFHSVAAPWTPRRMYEYWRDSTNLESHFGVGYDGGVGQFVGTETRADANMGANRRADGTGAISVETASDDASTDPWTDAQVAALVALGAWLHQRHGIPVRICPRWDAPGFGVHRMFPEWSAGGTACPGDARARQFREVVLPGIVAAAGGAPVPTPRGDSGPTGDSGPARYRVTINGLEYGYGAHGPQVREVGEALVRQGFGRHYASGPDEDWRDADTLNYQDFQHSLGYSGPDADGVPGEGSLRRLLGRLPSPRRVSLAHVVAAARTDPGAEQGHQTYGGEVRIVEQALADEGFLEQRWVDGSLGTRTVQAYAAFQRSLGYAGEDANGVPGQRSLRTLGDRRGFDVTD
ncbi:peptidoglycan-binding protein [Kitasatospora purpeofusca]|uniref:peptidoglycan-binding protein n=1 Tax=Kitasatospora purpeofusca TaxID=67352 RepID=UPI00225B46F0|nr:peptidoglycan-binding protein [Kitasatospora purpeofusca]MCX4754141.1 peptidoglycan-binding protein [Kitasatospora purpeofusca]WSR33582.1 peptidoglycan-binding protein [Kitasatospora purpeofusca]WSR41666.1 peptidoglycan-binding protein [Kitasatospora purpeofusca]